MSLFKKEVFKHSIGWDGIITFILSNILILLSMGSFLLWCYIKVYIMAKHTATNASNDAKYIIILGVRLNNNQISNDFLLRLERGISLFKASTGRYKILILGGITHNNTISESIAGVNYLKSHDIEGENLILEEKSKHTLENLSHARKVIGSSKTLMITNRYHLYRAYLLATGLKLKTYPIAAEKYFSFSKYDFLMCLKESYLVHWYFAGKLFVAIGRNKRTRERIS